MKCYIIVKHQELGYDSFEQTNLKVLLNKTDAEEYKSKVEVLYKRGLQFYTDWYEREPNIEDVKMEKLWNHIYKKRQQFRDSWFQIQESTVS